MYFIEMTFAFLVIFGVALFFRESIRVTMGEGVILSASLIILSLYVSSLVGSFIYGVYAVIAIAGIGMILFGIKAVRCGKMEAQGILSPVLVILFVLYVTSLVFLYNDFIQHIDELHHWAATVKYMLNADQMPVGMSVGNCAYATSLFLLFFQKFSGYNEQNMYVAAMLLAWIGFMLPFSNYSWKEWKKPGIYAVIVYIALFTLYMYGIKSLYVDVMLASWAGGLAGWWMNRGKRKTDYLVAGVSLLTLCFFKASAGPLMVLFVVMFMALYTLVVEKGKCEERKIRKFQHFMISICVLVGIGSAVLLFISASIKPVQRDMLQTASEEVQAQEWTLGNVELPEHISAMINEVKLSTSKIKQTFGAYLTKSIGAPLANRSNWKVGFVPFIFLFLVLFWMIGELYHERGRAKFYIMYSVFMSLSYAATVFFSFLFMFAYELSVELRSVERYFSICVIYLFVLILVELLRQKREDKKGIYKYFAVGILIFFTLGLNEKFIPNATAIDKENIAGYDKLSSISKQIEEVKAVIGEYDKIYFICQYPADNLAGAELYTASVSYYMDNQVSNYLQTPWKFTSTGSNIRLEEFDTSINELPSLLAQGGYTYLWVHTTNPYLTRELPLVLSCDEVADGHLYKVVYENGVATGLEFVKALAG